MLMPWIADDCRKKLAIVGICKNAGKTTILNAIIQHHSSIKWGVMSTGRDGEQEDVLYKTPKPQVHLNQGAIFCADATTLDAHGSAVSILRKTIWQSGGKQLWIARAEQEIYTEIGGPQSVSAQIACANLIIRLGAEKVLIDGSLDRKSIALSDSLDALILAVGAGYGDVTAIREELTRLLSLSSVPSYHEISPAVRKNLLDAELVQLRYKDKWHKTELSSLIGAEKAVLKLLDDNPSPEAIYIPGAYTEQVHNRLGSALKCKLIFRHPECIKLGSKELAGFLKEQHPLCLIPFNIQALTLNTSAIGAPPQDADSFRHAIRSSFPTLEIIDIMEQNVL